MKPSLVGFWLVNLTGLFFGLTSTPTAAQIIPDATLPENSIATPQGNTILIEGGTQTGTNLFHSWQEFSVPTGGTAYFNNALDIQNIFSRVTGGNISNIDGLIQANATANLFLLNPNGIIFGANTKLNIGGSFLASTANRVNFADGAFFSTSSSPNSSPLLSISVPIGLQFNQSPNNAGIIRVEGPRITRPLNENFSTAQQIINYQRSLLDIRDSFGVLPGKTLALFGGEVIFEGGKIKAEQGRISLGAISNGEIASSNNGSLLNSAFIVQPESAFGNIQFSQNSVVAASGTGGGNIQIAGNKVSLGDSSIVLADTLGNQNGGTFSIQASQLIIKDGSEVSTSTYSSGSGGILNVNASDSIEVSGMDNRGFASSLKATAVSSGNAGELSIATRNLLIANGGTVAVQTFGGGRGGNLAVNASESVQVSGIFDADRPSTLAGSTIGTGDGATIAIATSQFIIRDGGLVQVGTFGPGRGGSLAVNASDSVQLLGITDGNKSSTLLGSTTGTGDAGNIEIVTNNLIVRDGSVLGVQTTNAGRGGTLRINASDSVQILGTSEGESPSILLGAALGTGDAGNIEILTNNLIVRDGSVVAVGTFGAGRGGKLTINADSVELIGSLDGNLPRVLVEAIDNRVSISNIEGGLLAATVGGTGDAGNIEIVANRLSLRDRAIINVSSFSTPEVLNVGKPGNINIQAGDIRLFDRARLSAVSPSTQGGNIGLRARSIQLRQNSQISAIASARNNENQGNNILISTGTLVALENSNIIANAFGGIGANIAIRTEGIFLSADSQIIASGSTNVTGVNTIAPPNIPKIEVAVNETQIAQRCSGVSRENSFVVTGKGGLPSSPDDALSADAVWIDLRVPRSNNRQRSQLKDRSQLPAQPLVEAQGWTIAPDGQITLTVTSPNLESQFYNLNSPTCRAN